MKDVFVGVDPELEKIYRNILKKLLETPQDWKRQWDSSQYASPKINDESDLCFITFSSTNDNYLKKIKIVDHTGNIVHELPLNNREIKNLMKRLYRFMTHYGEWLESQKANKILKEGLGTAFERLQKLLKIKNKISE
jgi:hypothetical protein